MPESFQKAGLALLLCAPSTLHNAWAADDAVAFEAELTRLNVSAAALKTAKDARANTQLRAKAADFNSITGVLKTDFWAGGEPHPPDADAVRLMAVLRALDGD